MVAPKSLPSDSHLKKVWIALGATLLLSFIAPPAFVLFQAVAVYWVVLLCISILRIIVSTPSRPRPSTSTPQAPPTYAAPGWESEWKKLCESPAEVAFLDAAIKYFSLRPSSGALVGEIRLNLQKQISNMRVDFLVNEKLVVEVDGAAYHSSKARRENDFNRDNRLRDMGYAILRIPASVVFSKPQEAMNAVRANTMATRA